MNLSCSELKPVAGLILSSSYKGSSGMIAAMISLLALAWPASLLAVQLSSSEGGAQPFVFKQAFQLILMQAEVWELLL